MGQIKLRNATSGTTKIGRFVKLAPNSKTHFVYAELGEVAIIGTTAQSVIRGASCLINPINTVRWEDVVDKPPDLIPAPESITIQRDGDGNVTSIIKPSKIISIAYHNGELVSLKDNEYLWTINKTGNLVTGVTVTKI